MAASSAVVAACSATKDPVVLGSSSVDRAGHHAAFVNGGFESGNIGDMPPTGWTLQNYKNPGVNGTATAPPASFAALNLTGLGTMVNETYVVGGATMSQADPDLGTGESFRYPIYGTQAARVNYRDPGTNGKNQNANLIRQVMTVGLDDIDAMDGQVHVRSTIAPVLENPAHSFSQQPYFFVELANLTRGTTLYSAFNTAGQAGVPWHNTTSLNTHNAVQWLDWALLDIAAGADAVAIGEQVQLTVVGSGCSLGGHFGRIYVDAAGSSIPGPFVSALGPESVKAGGSITYTLNYTNGVTAPQAAIGAHVDMTVPPQTTFASVAGITGCTTPAAGATGTLSCPIGTLAPGATGSFTVTVNVLGSATGSIVNGTYSIGAVNAPTLLGPKLATTVLGSGTNTIDIEVTKTAAVSTINWGDATHDCPSGSRPGCAGITPLFTIVARNLSTTTSTRGIAPTLTDAMSATLDDVYWECTAGTGADAGAGTATYKTKCWDASGTANINRSGTGNISLKMRLGYYQVGTTNPGKITIKVWAKVKAGSGLGSVVNTALSTTAVGYADPDLANNNSTVTLQVGTPRTLSVTKAGSSSSGTVTSVPAGIDCPPTTACAPAAATFADGAQVLLSAAPIAGASFAGWSGVDAPAACQTSPAPTTCTIAMSGGNKSITATFAAPPPPASAANIYVYSGSPQNAPVSTAFANPLVVLVTDANGNPKSGVTVSFTAVPAANGASATVAASAQTNAAGLASLTATANATPGSYAVSATGSGLPTVNFSLINVGPPASIIYVSGGNVTYDASDRQKAAVGTQFAAPLVAQVLDANLVPVPGVTVTYTSPGSGASTTPTTATAISNGNGQSRRAVTANNTTGQYSVNASVAGLATPARFDLENVTTGPAAVYAVSGTPQVALLSTAFSTPLVAVVSDAVGNAVPGVTVTFQAPTSGATATLAGGAACPTPSNYCRTAVSNSLGQVTITATANASPGHFTVTASTGGATPALFYLTNDGGNALQAIAGTPQVAAINHSFPMALVAQVLNSDGDPVTTGVPVSFQAPMSGATATLTGTGGTSCGSGCVTVTSDGNGNATVTAAANGIAGDYLVVAATPTAANGATFHLTNQCQASTDCAAGMPVCSGNPGACGPCTQDSQCGARNANTPKCNAASGLCVACLNDSECNNPTPICNQATNICSACTTDGQCDGKDPTKPMCTAGACTGCAGPADCTGDKAVCLGGACVVCAGNRDCTSAAAPACNTTTHTCEACTGDPGCAGHDGTPACLAGACVGCASNANCGNPTPICNPSTHACAPCATDTDCGPNQSCRAGACVSPGADGQACSGDGQCTNGHCVASVCCHTPCGTCGTCTSGICQPLARGSGGCGHFVCDGTSADCPTTCSKDADCATDAYCAAGTCAPKKVVGTACTGDSQCALGHCVDAVCCDRACAGQCQACGTGGHCSNVTGAPVGTRPPCTTDSTACGGSCDGSSATVCAYPAGETSCRGASCAGELQTLAAACAGTGKCPTVVQSTCGRYVCGATACKTSCAADGDCSSGNVCRGGACQAALTITVTITGGHGTLLCPTAVVLGTSPVCAIKPEDGYTLDTLTDEAGATAPVDVFALVASNVASDPNDDTYTIVGMQTDHALSASFKRRLGIACVNALDCHSGICTDGVCCNAPCTGQCQACDVLGSTGTCSAATGAPHGGRPGCAGRGTTCGGACDGLTVDKCVYANEQTSCKAGSCSAGVAVPESFCDGHGACPDEAPVTCGASGCTGASCGTDCSSSVPCVSGSYCSAGLCLPWKANGLPCTHGSQCTSTFCADGVCCDSACDRQCAACAEAGSAGTCTPVSGSPRGARAPCVTDGSSCGGSCKGTAQAACSYPSATTQCRAQSCAADVVTQSALCDGAGACGALHTSSCGRYVCTRDGCMTACTTSADCAAGHGCLSGLCQPAFRVTVVVDGHGSVACQDPVPVGSVSVCQIAPELGYVLAALTDAAAGETAANVLALVDSKGTADLRDDTYTTAVLEADHVIRATFRLVAGATCLASGDCQAGFCVDGLCCDTACTGQCEACNLPSSPGVCTAVVGQPMGQRTPCTGDGTGCAGACDGKGRTTCAYPGADLVCRQPSCANGAAVVGATCQGTGACPPLQIQSCGQYTCGSDACLGNCTRDVDCNVGEYCSAGICVTRWPVGAACASGGQCASGFCVDGVCCDTACAGQCQACDLPGSTGTCATLSGAAPHGGRVPCAGSGPCQGICDGTSPMVCAVPGAAVPCGQARCANGAETIPGRCDGLGACMGGETHGCGLFQCDAASCKTACASDLDCVDSARCVAGACTLDSALDAGSPAPSPDASSFDAGEPDGPAPLGFHAMGGGCRCSAGQASRADSAALAVAWLALLFGGAGVGRRRHS
jgi:hypothetical protein